MNTRLTRSLLTAAALIGTASVSQAYHFNDWEVSQPSLTWGTSNVGNSWSYTASLSLSSTHVDSGLYSIAWTGFNWDGNEYSGSGNWAYVESSSYLSGTNPNFTAGSPSYLGFGYNDANLYTGSWVNNTGGVSHVIPLGTTAANLYMRLDGTYLGADVNYGINVYERGFQVARTNDNIGSQNFGSSAAFESDNYDTSSYYNRTIAGRYYAGTNVLDTARYWDGEGYSSLTGSVVRTADIVLGPLGRLEGLYAKDGGWLDIRGDLTVGANGTVYIRDGEITSDVYTQYNNTGTGHLGRVNFEAGLGGEGATLGIGQGGILSVRQHFAQDMYATGSETLGFRDGAVNTQSIFIDGDGYNGGNGAFGSLRSITGDNVQNGNIGIGWNGSQYTTIGVDQDSVFTINGRINGANGVGSNADKDLVLNVASYGTGPTSAAGLILNGDIRSSVRDVIQVNNGVTVLNVANAFSGHFYAAGGLTVVHNADALGANTVYVTNSNGNSASGCIMLDARNVYPAHFGTAGDPASTANLTVANNFEIAGTGHLGSGALANVSGDNEITGTITVGTNGYVGQSVAASDATIAVYNGTHLTVAGLTANKSLIGWTLPYTTTLTINTVNGFGRTGTFTNLGDTGTIDRVVKEGDGDAYLGTAAASLLTFEVNGGRLFIDSLSTSPTSFGTFDKNGAGSLVIRDTVADGVDAHYGRYNVNAGTLSTDSGANAVGDVYVYANGTLGGKGTFTGNVYQTGGAVAPGFSPGTLTIVGNYSNVGGSLNLELAGTATAGTSYDQLRVTGSIVVSNANPVDYSTIKFVDIDGFEAKHGDVFQVIAGTNGVARNTYDKFDLSQTVTGASDRVLFDHSTGKAYGTGLTTLQNFSDYGKNRNQREIGRALWMEAIDFDKSGTTGELPQSFIDSATVNGAVADPTLATVPAVNAAVAAAAAKTGLKAWMLTRHDNVLGELSTDLGAAAVQMLTASSGAAGLDSLSPEPYSGFSEIATRLNRNFAKLGATSRKSGDDNKWGFDFGYSGEQLTSSSTSAYTSAKASSDTAYLLADLALGTKAHLSLSAGLDDGRVLARGFSGDTTSAVFGIGLGITPESKFARFDLGASYSTMDLDAVRQGSYMSESNQNAYAVSARVTFLPKDAPVNAVAQVKEGAPSKLSLTPYVGVAYASADIDGFSEADVPGTAQLNVAGFKRRSLVGELGIDADYAVGANTTLTGVLAYEHEFHNSGRTNMTAEFADAGVDDTSFAIRTDGYGANIFRLGVGIRQQLGTKASLGLGYDVLLGSGVSSGQKIKADLSFRF